MRNGTATSGERIPGAIQMGFVDGHASTLPLQKLKTVYWHRDYVPTEDPWRTIP
jgi:prepilin-type processing-associated H-X9-DG protein